MSYFGKLKKTFNFQLSTLNSEHGQAILIIVLVMVIGLTIGLALVSRSVTNVRTSTEEENSQRAFSAAEAGIEQALKETPCTEYGADDICTKSMGSSGDIGNFSNYFNVTIKSRTSSELLLNGGNTIPQDEGVDLWLVPHNADGTLNYSTLWTGKFTIHWGNQNSEENCQNPDSKKWPAALEVIVITGPTNSVKSYKSAYDKCGSSAYRNNGFNSSDSGGGGTVEGRTFGYKTNNGIDIQNGILVRIVPIYKSTAIGIEVTNGSKLPSQGKLIEATGKSGNTQRKITYFQGYPSMPIEFFPYILFSP